MKTHRDFLPNIFSGKEIIFLCSFLFTYSLFAQGYLPGFVINQQGDSLRGYILFKDHSFNRKNCKYKATQEAKVQNFSADMIQSYGVDGKALFKSYKRRGKSELVFLEYLLYGSPSLLHFGSTYFLESEGAMEELISKTDTVIINGKTYLKDSDTYKQQLLQQFQGCNEISSMVSETELSPKSLMKLFTVYYECTKSNYTNLNSKGNNLRIRLGAAMRVGRISSFSKRFAGSTYYFDGADPKWSYILSPNILIHLSYPRLNSNLAVRTGLAFSKYTYSNAEVNDRAGPELFYEMDIESSFLEIPFYLIYNFTKSGSQVFVPYVFVGGSMNAMINLTGDRKTSTLSGDLLSSNTFEGQSTFFSARAGLGGSFRISNSISVFGEIFGDSSNGYAIPDDNDVMLYLKSINLTIGAFF